MNMRLDSVSSFDTGSAVASTDLVFDEHNTAGHSMEGGGVSTTGTHQVIPASSPISSASSPGFGDSPSLEMVNLNMGMPGQPGMEGAGAHVPLGAIPAAQGVMTTRGEGTGLESTDNVKVYVEAEEDGGSTESTTSEDESANELYEGSADELYDDQRTAGGVMATPMDNTPLDPVTNETPIDTPLDEGVATPMQPNTLGE